MTAILIRKAMGETLRTLRQEAGMTLREVSVASMVSLGYLSEIERGCKEASSEVLYSIALALGASLSDVLRLVSETVADQENAALPTRRIALAA
ncbi:MAG: helix-turn-helix domain-containing protein [Propionibacteriaceae bacterium]|nr:helix-turn-helix domain-containing protein [Propionibacteriaceae bacterium]